MAGLPITGYKYALATSADSYATYGGYQTSSWTSGTSFTITGLTNGTYYKIKIRAVNALGEGTDSAEIGPFRPNTVPSPPAAATLTAGNATDTFTWVAPASNGSTITQYGYQVSADNGLNWYSTIDGTLNGETVTANLSAVLATQYKASSYKLRVRAFNNGSNGGWGERSTISSSGTAVWTSSGALVDDNDPLVCPLPNCDGGCGTCAACGACECGTSSITGSPGSRTATARTTDSRTCYRWTRTSTGSTASGYIYDQNSTNPCSSAYSACSGGSCSGCSASTCGCSACGTVSTVSGSNGQIVQVSNYGGGQDHRTYYDFFGMWAVTNSSGTFTWQVGQCGGACSSQGCFVFSTSVTQCSSTGAYTAVGYAQRGNCANFGFGCTGSGSC